VLGARGRRRRAVWVVTAASRCADQPAGSYVVAGATVTADPAAPEADDVATDGVHAWVAEAAGTLSELDAKARRLARVALPARPVAVAYGEGSVWVALARGDLLRVDPSSLRIERTIHLAMTPTAVAVGGGHVWIAIA
jgi:hypothetical protein